jgi:1,4-dihydroxy-2-naphthoate octaprenyltransferase
MPAHIRITPTFSIVDGVKTQIGYCGKTKVLEGVDPKTTMPKDPWWIKMLSALVITRLPFLSATWIPVILGAVWAFNGGIANPRVFDWSLFGVVFLGASFLHLAANTFNDYFDWQAGTDQANNDYFLQYTGGSRAIELGIITEKGLFRLASSFIVLAAVCGIAIMFGPWSRGLDLLYYAAAGALGGFFYTAPPLKLSARRGLGELTIGLLFGPVLTMGTVYALTGIHSQAAFLVGIPVGLLTISILWVNEFPDVPSDIATGKVHLVAALGIKNARWGYLTLMAACFVVIYLLYQNGVVNQGALLSLIVLPAAAYLTYRVFSDYDKRELAKTCANTIYFQMVAGLLLILGISLLG